MIRCAALLTGRILSFCPFCPGGVCVQHTPTFPLWERGKVGVWAGATLLALVWLLAATVTAGAHTLTSSDLRGVGFDPHPGQQVPPDLAFRIALERLRRRLAETAFLS